MTRLPAPVTALLLALGACSADRITTQGTPQVSFDADAWSRGVLVLRSAAFRGADARPVVTGGADTLGVRPFQSDSILVQLPDTTGSVELWVHLSDGGGGPIGAVRLHGFVGVAEGPRQWQGRVDPWESGTVVGYVAGRLSILNVSTGSLFTLLSDSGLDGEYCLEGPMPSAVPGMLVVSHWVNATTRCGPPIAVPVAADAPPPDTGPAPPSGTMGFGPVLHLARGHWLIASWGQVQFVSGSPSAGFVGGPTIANLHTWRFVTSPRGDRAVAISLGGSASADGAVPVFDLQAQGVAFTLPSLLWISGATFSRGGDTLFVVGGGYSYGQLLAVDATNGSVLTRTELHRSGTLMAGVALDSERPLVYVLDGGAAEVIDRSTGQPIARLQSRRWLGQGGPMDDVTAVFGAGRRLYAVGQCLDLLCGEMPYLYRFDLIP